MNVDAKALSPGDLLTIGQLAAAAGVHVETVRYYQRESLVPTPRRAYGSIRRYGADDVRRLRFIKRAQVLGFTLSEVGGLLHLDAACACADTRALAARKLALIERRMADLAAMQKVLVGLVQQCDAGNDGTHCPIIDVLAKE